MKRISRQKVKDFDGLVDLLYSIQTKAELKDFLYGVTTPNERKELPRRVQIVQQLLDGNSQHTIAERLNVGIATVTRGSKELSQGKFRVLKDGTNG